MALFGKKKNSEGVTGDSASGAVDGWRPDPAKAESFYKHARTMHEASNDEYAVTLWLRGLRQDPASMTGLESFYACCQSFISQRGKFGAVKDQVKCFCEKTATPKIEKTLAALLQWGTNPLDVAAGIKVIEAMQRIEGVDMIEPIYWVGEKVLEFARRDKKTKKSHLVKLKDLFVEAGVFELGVKAGEAALMLDPSDGHLQGELRNLSAQATMSTGGYESTGEAGGFRSNIRDSSKQRELEEEERIVKTEDVVDRAIARSKADYESRPTDTAAIQKYTRALMDRGTPADEKAAFVILTKAYKETVEFRFRQQAGEIKIRQGRRKIRQLRDAAQANPNDADAQEKYARGKRALTKLEIEEYTAQVNAYPTNLSLKFELGKRYYELGKLQEAIELFQVARDDPKRRATCLSYLGQAFLKLGWQDEAIDTLRAAIEAHPVMGDDTGRELRYALMLALETKAREESDRGVAEEAAKIASGIAIEQINFKDIGARRIALQSLVKELRDAEK